MSTQSLRQRGWLLAAALLLLVAVLGWMSGGQIRMSMARTALILATPEFAAAALVAATPLILAALGGLISELSGTLNLALEAMMLCGALAAYVGAIAGGSPWAGLLAAIVVGIAIGLIHAWFSIDLRVNQIVSAVALNLFALAVTAFMFRLLFGNAGAMLFSPGFQPVEIPLLSQLPYLGPALFRHTALVYLSLLLVPAIWFVLYHTSWGLALRSVGEHPLAADTLGIAVNRVRYIALIVSGALAGASGSALVSASGLNTFQENMSAGRGYIAFAAIVFGRWHPVGTLIGAVLFGLGDALQIRLQAYSVPVPYQLLLMLPYVITLLALVLFMRNARGPAASGIPYVKEG